MKATFLTDSEYDNGRNLTGDKEQFAGYIVVGMVKGKMTELVRARAWMGRSRSASAVYASIWVNSAGKDSNYRSGYGRAGGYGYHKLSAAMGEAIESAGIVLTNDEGQREYIGGVGERAIEDALLAIARAQGCRSRHLRVLSI